MSAPGLRDFPPPAAQPHTSPGRFPARLGRWHPAQNGICLHHITPGCKITTITSPVLGGILHTSPPCPGTHTECFDRRMPSLLRGIQPNSSLPHVQKPSPFQVCSTQIFPCASNFSYASVWGRILSCQGRSWVLSRYTHSSLIKSCQMRSPAVQLVVQC